MPLAPVGDRDCTSPILVGTDWVGDFNEARNRTSALPKRNLSVSSVLTLHRRSYEAGQRNFTPAEAKSSWPNLCAGSMFSMTKTQFTKITSSRMSGAPE